MTDFSDDALKPPTAGQTLPLASVDPDGLLEYSAVFSDRSLNHMSARFISVMQELQSILKGVYHAHSMALVPGGGTYAMESVVRQFARDAKAVVIRTGNFSFRWSQIFDASDASEKVTVLSASPTSSEPTAPYAPPRIDEATAAIREHGADIVFAAHVETAAGLELPFDYIAELAQATHDGGGLFVLDCVASGTKWANMEDLGVDIVITAPQKGWSGSPSTGYVLFSEEARTRLDSTTSDSFALDLAKWTAIAEGYVSGTAAYHATMPTDAIEHNLQLAKLAVDFGLEKLTERQVELGTRVRKVLADKGFHSVAAEGFEASSIVVMHAPTAELANGSAFKEQGLQIAAGVPLQVGEPDTFATFRLGLFGLDKWADVDAAVERLEKAVAQIAV
ncbi:aminotransferase class V-fold PLP-dependent enzyme [Corynebacterium aquatimens]|uniref:Aspartate aminotransferase-like enzyme n=1 Tax=Corynebacterium aquatimens TaxID=1190508 RepID=A0A931GUY5_9CORY|nr:aminotransferase class V-fold PLP-dependent enzyme [Corynebacterium aquatimens]MBG6123240.1 aspartate aminotransferase-like enzyme [Corynebacterium aquatimens]WJY66431.1 2-aminoethylphosphonate--pyruvate transaminase [Corynebacterium aquatimens]